MLLCSTHLSRCLHPFQIPCKLPLLFHDSAQKSFPLSCPHSQPHHRSPAISNLACITIICRFCLPNWFNFSNTAFLYFPVSLNFETILWGRCEPPYYTGKKTDRPSCPRSHSSWENSSPSSSAQASLLPKAILSIAWGCVHDWLCHMKQWVKVWVLILLKELVLFPHRRKDAAIPVGCRPPWDVTDQVARKLGKESLNQFQNITENHRVDLYYVKSQEER